MQYATEIKDKTGGYQKVPEFQKFYKLSLYLNKLEPFRMNNPLKFTEDVPITLNVQFNDFIKRTSKR